MGSNAPETPGGGTTDRSDRISLSWQQVAWGITSLLAITASYFSVVGKIEHLEASLSAYYTKDQVNAMIHDLDRTSDALDRRLERVEQRRAGHQ